MIFVTLGTQDKSFKRILKIIDRAIEENIIKEEVVVQAGYTKYKSDKMNIMEYVSRDEFDSYMQSSNLLITHGGVGSIFTGLKYNKKILAMSRLSKYKEHTNDHQVEIIEEFSKQGYILSFDDFDSFKESYKKLKGYEFKKYKSNRNKLVKLLNDFINDRLG